MHANGALQALPATPAHRAHKARRSRNTNTKGAVDMGPVVLAITALGVVWTITKDHPEWSLLFWVAFGISVWIVYKRFSAVSRALLVAASAMTALTAIGYVFTAWF